jgi:L-seryl-tRNA(Ser) seleniumtransferase
MSVYAEMGVKRVVNGSFCLTVLGGSTLSKEVQDAMIEANKCFVAMEDLQEQAGKIIAQLTGAEAAAISSGAFSSMILAAAACLAGKDLEKMQRLPHTEGMKNEIIIQRNLRSSFDRAMEVAGGKFVEVDPNPAAMEAAITDKTVAIHYLSNLDPPRPDVMPLEKVIEIGHKHGVPIIVDAAGQTYPTDRMKMFVRMGADLVCHSGKYVWGPNSTGWIVGKKYLVEAAAAQCFVGERMGGASQGWIGRGMKLDRQEIVGLVVAIKRWMAMDHEKERFQPARARRDYLIETLQDLPNIKLTAQPYSYHVVGLRVTFEKKTPEQTAELVKQLEEGDPSIRVRGGGGRAGNSILINTMFLVGDDEKVIADRLRSLLTGG